MKIIVKQPSLQKKIKSLQGYYVKYIFINSYFDIIYFISLMFNLLYIIYFNIFVVSTKTNILRDCSVVLFDSQGLYIRFPSKSGSELSVVQDLNWAQVVIS